MTHTLVTFLGRPQFADDRDREYRLANYLFPGEEKPRCSAFFGLALADYLDVDKLVILGTSGSMWGVLVLSLAQNFGDGVEEKISELLAHEDIGQVTDIQIESLTDTMCLAVGRPVTPRLIPSAKDTDEQLEILQAVSDVVPDQGDVSFDLTHGFRHLGMVGFLSAFMLEQVKRLSVRGLWYGALDMTHEGITPVLRLDGLSSVRRWMDALNRFDASGDYGVFAPLLRGDGVSKRCAQYLKGAAFHERTLNLSRAANEIQCFLPILNEPLQGASELFRHRLRDRLKWAEGDDLATQQRTLAFEYLKRRDFMRAAVFGWEALVTKECTRHPKLNPEGHDTRQSALRRLRKRISRRKGGCMFHAFFNLQDIRNAFAHGGSPKEPMVGQILGNADVLEQRLNEYFNRLLM